MRLPLSFTRKEELSGLLASPSLNKLATFAAPVHVNTDFAGQASDHGPLLAYFNISRGQTGQG